MSQDNPCFGIVGGNSSLPAILRVRANGLVSVSQYFLEAAEEIERQQKVIAELQATLDAAFRDSVREHGTSECAFGFIGDQTKP